MSGGMTADHWNVRYENLSKGVKVEVGGTAIVYI